MSEIPDGEYQPDEVVLQQQDGKAYVRYGGCTSGCGDCCWYVVIPVDPRVLDQPPDRFEDWKDWLDLHGIILVSPSVGRLDARIPIRCDALTFNNTCVLFGTNQRPDMCSTFPEKPRFIDPPYRCTYKYREVMSEENASEVQRQMIELEEVFE
jgi:hypothetical protein